MFYLVTIAWIFCSFLQVFPTVLGLQEAYAAGPTLVTHSMNKDCASTLDVAKPAGTIEGDLLVAIISTDGDVGSITVSDGPWKVITAIIGNGHSTQSWYKIAGDSEPDNYTFTTDYECMVAGILLIRDFYPSVPIQLPVGISTGDDAAPTSPSISTILDNSLIIRYFGCDAERVDEGLGYPASHTGLYITGTGGVQGTSSGVAWTTKTPEGSTGPASFTLTKGDEWAAVTIAVTPGDADLPDLVPQADHHLREPNPGHLRTEPPGLPHADRDRR